MSDSQVFFLTHYLNKCQVAHIGPRAHASNGSPRRKQYLSKSPVLLTKTCDSLSNISKDMDAGSATIHLAFQCRLRILLHLFGKITVVERSYGNRRS